MRKRRDPTRRNQVILGILLAAIMLFSSVGFFVGQNPATALQYGKYTFETTQQGYRTKIQGVPFDFFFMPQDVETLEFPPDGEAILRSRALIIAFDPNMTDLNLQLADLLRFDVQQRLGIRVVPGLTRPGDPPFPLLSCPNASAQMPAVIVEEANETRATLEGVCLYVQGNESGLFQLRDRLFYEHFGVIQ